MQVASGEINKLYFRAFDLLFSNGAHWNKASRLGEEKRHSSKENKCKSNTEESFAHRREIYVFEKPLKRGRLTRPILI